jgi:hypothetical protein
MHDLESSKMKTPEQHYLLVGQRGAGKSTLLSRIKYAVEDSVKLRPVLIPILFGEEQYNVGELANLWENVAQVLEDYHGFDGLYGEMEKYIHDKNFEEKCWDILELALDKKGRKLLLLIDNIGDMFKKIGELEVRRLRELLQTKSQVRVIAGSPFYLESLLDYKQPLFEFFKVMRLDELSSGETFHLLLKLGEIHGERGKIEKIIKETPGRVESLRTLTGGVPRTIALMFNIFIEHEHENSLKDLDKILDNVTPLYKHRMDDLPAQQQKIVDAVAKHWDPISVKDLKNRVRLESKVISAQLRQLEKDQVVQKMETGTKNHEYILKERFFNIWYLMRYGRKDDKQKVIWLVRFLESWCTDEEIKERVVQFIEQVKKSRIDKDKSSFLGEAYTSLRTLKVETKMLLDESLPEHRSNLKFTSKEIDEIVKNKIKEKDFKSIIKWLSFRKTFAEKDKLILLRIMVKEEVVDIDLIKYAHELFEQNSKESKPLQSVYEVYRTILLIATEILGIELLYAGSFDEAINSQIKILKAIGETLGQDEDFDIFSSLGFELRIILTGLRLFYLNGQYHSLVKIFEQNEIFLQKGNKALKFSEIFNPIYLALKFLDPDGKKVNIAPEKEAIVRLIRDSITAKN